MTTFIENQRQKELGLALSGGGARGLAHIGVLRALANQSIHISCISGCSMGGLVAALFALGRSSDEISEIALKYTTIREMVNLVDRTPNRRGLIVGNRLRNLLARLIGKNTTFEDTHIPLVLNATDLVTGQEVAFTQGNLLDAVMATIAVPGFFAPICKDSMILMDGGVVNNLPVNNLLKFNPQVTIAVDVHPETRHEITWNFSENKPRFLFPLPDFFADFYQSQMIMVSRITEMNLTQVKPDLLLKPCLPAEITIFSGYQRASKIIASGESAATENMEQIHQLLY